MLSLTIHHVVHLTKEQRYSLHEGNNIETTGISVPVWIMNKTTSEPAHEVFCRYILKNPRKDMPIQVLEDGYEITIPYREGSKLNITDEEWRHLNMNDPRKLDALYKMTPQSISSQNLLNEIDGGSNSLCYREHNKVKKEGKTLQIMHYVCLESSM